MIQQLSKKYRKGTAAVLFVINYCGIVLPVYADNRLNNRMTVRIERTASPVSKIKTSNKTMAAFAGNGEKENMPAKVVTQKAPAALNAPATTFIGGPSQPEMSAFKSVGVDNMVNLFSGNFSYNIPLMDVGGYPVNIFYDGGVSMEQEASWVGLGWNINPGNVNRNMRGIPDDFNGEEKLKTTQTMKPNNTWGVGLGVDLELVGIKGLSIGASLGVSLNNYLGPAIEAGVKGGYSISLGDKAKTEKQGGLSAGIGIGASVNSRSGLSISPYLSLSAKTAQNDKTGTWGTGLQLSTSYNSRAGIRSLQISEQVSFNRGIDDDHKSYGDKDMASQQVSATTHSGNLFSSTISFSKPSYTPALRMPVTNKSIAGRFQIGGAIYGIYANAELEGYTQESFVADGDVTIYKPMIGYLHSQKATADAVMDFNRLNDNEVLPNTPVISAPQYSYDVFSIQGEGTGGSIRAYRNDDSYVRDNYTRSKDKSVSFGIDIGIPGHIGANVNIVKTPTIISEWNSNNKLRTSLKFKDAEDDKENVYFRNPGETSVLNANQFDRIGGLDLVRFKLGGSNTSPSVEPLLERFLKTGYKSSTTNMVTTAASTERKKRTQVTSFLTAKEASEIGLDKKIKSYNTETILDDNNVLKYEEIDRYDGTIRRQNHISQINVTEANGSRYVYGIPVYNIKQKDFTFTVNNTLGPDADKVAFNADETTKESPYLSPSPSNKKDGYLLATETPAYSHSFLLSGLLSNDYVDITGNGITEDDLGNAVKFNYSKMNEIHKWRTPLSNTQEANLNAGKRTDKKDDKGIISYGERESWYMHSIESKTMIALFTLENRADGKGALGELTGINGSDNSEKRLKKIDLYSKADLKKNGLAGAKPIKTVNFQYSYTLCAGTPDNPSGNGKLTLEGIYFTFNGQQRASKNKYVFGYTANGGGNPAYSFNASDRWGDYKPASQNPGGIKNADHPYSTQNKTNADANAGAWLLKKILLPSGGQMDVNYESDDYAFVQNKRAARMMEVVGFNNTASTYSNKLYAVNGLGIVENNYAFIKVPEACSNSGEVYKKYIKGMEQLSFKLAVNMPDGMEYMNSYATIDASNYGVYSGDVTNKTIWVKLKNVDGLSPLSLSAIEFLRQQLPGQAYDSYDVSEGSGFEQMGKMLMGLLDGLRGGFKNPVQYLREKGLAQTVDLARCFVRLNEPNGYKYGGGYRVKSVVLKDNWKLMNQGQLYTSIYGQEYDYTTKETFEGVERTISSGVASYEPSLGGDENPFQTMLQVSDKVPLGPTSYGAIEMPLLDAFFPSPSVGYSKVTVRSVKKGPVDPTKKSRSGIGKQVTEFYTAKDFPVYYNHTVMDPSSDLRAHSSANVFFYKTAFDSRAMSQGFLVETNDMHGKMKSQASYAENDEKTAINYTENFYRNTGVKGLDEKFDFVYAAEGGAIHQGNMGIDVELMTDTREFSVKTQSLEIQAQIDLFPVVIPFFLPFIWPVISKSENTYRAVTCTKVITYHSILDSVRVIDKGSQVSTKNILFDSETGNVIVSRTNNEFKQPIYNTNYPAWWAYSGMGLAYKNIDAVYKGKNFLDGVISGVPASAFESGDEIYITDPGTAPSTGCAAQLASPGTIKMLWVIDKKKDNSSLTSINPQYVFIDKDGKPYTRNNVSFRIVRSGHRNILSNQASTIVSMTSPVVGHLTPKLALPVSNKVINASAVEYKERWQTDNNLMNRYTITKNPTTCVTTVALDCEGGDLEQSINPYLKGLLGTFRPHRSLLFYGNRTETNPTAATNVSQNGFYSDFGLYWDFNISNNLVPAITNPKWVWNSQVKRVSPRGLELETKDALNIYTAAQYGYNKTMPTAITNNARSAEMFYEGFEDTDYNERLNDGTVSSCNNPHFKLLDPAHASIINTQSQSFQAHTGKYVMKVNAGATASVNNTIKSTLTSTVVDNDFSANPGENYYFPLKYEGDHIKELSDIGGTSAPYNQENWPGGLPSHPPVFGFGGNNVSMSANYSSSGHQQLYPHTPSNTARLQYYYKTTQYVVVPATKNHTFTMQTSQSWEDLTNPRVVLDNQADIYVMVKKLNGDLAWSGSVHSSDGSYKEQTFTGIYLTCDTFELTTIISASLIFQGTDDEVHSCGAVWNLFTNIESQTYKSLYPSNACAFTKPIPGDIKMFNPTFNLTEGKKMLFSAWTKQTCAAPCTTQTFTKSKVKLQFNDGSSTYVDIVPQGPIIEGWQKMEGVVTVPANATVLTTQFINTDGSNPIYFDDIRLHPYNGNMKSYVYDPVNLRLSAELDANNYAVFYEYDEEGTLIRTKAETREGVKTLTETRSAKQKNITLIDQP